MSKMTFSDPLCGPKAFRLVLIEALGPSSRCIFMLAQCARTRAPATVTCTLETAPCTVEQMVGLTTCPRLGEPNLHEICM